MVVQLVFIEALHRFFDVSIHQCFFSFFLVNLTKVNIEVLYNVML